MKLEEENSEHESDVSNLSEEDTVLLINTSSDTQFLFGGLRLTSCVLGVMLSIFALTVFHNTWQKTLPGHKYRFCSFILLLIVYEFVAILYFVLQVSENFLDKWIFGLGLCRLFRGLIQSAILVTPALLLFFMTLSLGFVKPIFKDSRVVALLILLAIFLGFADGVQPFLEATLTQFSMQGSRCELSMRAEKALVWSWVIGVQFVLFYLSPFVGILLGLWVVVCPNSELARVKGPLVGVVGFHWLAWLPTQVKRLFLVFSGYAYHPEEVLLDVESLWLTVFLTTLYPAFLLLLIQSQRKTVRTIRFNVMDSDSQSEVGVEMRGVGGRGGLREVPLSETNKELYRQFLQSNNGMPRVSTVEWGFA